MNIHLKFLLFSAFLLIGISLQAQNTPTSGIFSGKWSGFLTQEGLETQIATSYGYEMILVQKGAYVSGTTTINANGKEGKLTFSGVAFDNMVSFHDIEIVDDNLNGKGNWCLKNVVLSYNATTKTLSGAWGTESCGNGKAELSRTAILIMESSGSF